MNRKGMTLVELLGAIVIFGILIAISALLVSFFIDANNKITISSQANYEGILAIRTIKKDIENLNPNTYDTCKNDKCLILISEYQYNYNDLNDSIDLNIYKDPVEYNLKIDKSILYINDVEYVFDGFSLSDKSKIIYEEIDDVLYITIPFYLVAINGDEFDFVFSYSYVLTDIPKS